LHYGFVFCGMRYAYGGVRYARNDAYRSLHDSYDIQLRVRKAVTSRAESGIAYGNLGQVCDDYRISRRLLFVKSDAYEQSTALVGPDSTLAVAVL
jgi:hypothetical protein